MKRFLWKTKRLCWWKFFEPCMQITQVTIWSKTSTTCLVSPSLTISIGIWFHWVKCRLLSLYLHNWFCELYVLIYVDNILVTSSSNAAIDSFILSLKESFLVKDLGELSFCLGVQATRGKHSLHIWQIRYIMDLLECTKMGGAKPLNYPTTFGPKLSSEEGKLLIDPTKYCQVARALQ